MTKPFFIFGPSHIAVLVLFVVLSVVFCVIARKNSKIGNLLAKCLATVLLANQLMYMIYCGTRETVNWSRLFPMELCEWTLFLAAIALWTRRQLFYVLTYFWAMAGTLQATLTPDLAYDFPHMFFFVFFITHAGILVAVMLLTFGFRLRPQPKSFCIAWLYLQGYLALALIINGLFKTNYGYLCWKPHNPSLLDYLGPRPWYILSLEVVAIALFGFWYLPFLIYDKLRTGKIS